MDAIAKLLMGLFALLLLCSCQQGELYKRDLLNTIKSSDTIIVTEHSDFIDFYDEKLTEQKEYIEKVYEKLELNALQRKLFFEHIQRVKNKTQDEFPACEPEIHHTIQFYRKGVLFSTLKICFECGQIEWDGSKYDPPLDIYNGLESFVKSIGLHPERDWEKLAKLSK
jgi:uncharacterized protein with PIN domain